MGRCSCRRALWSLFAVLSSFVTSSILCYTRLIVNYHIRYIKRAELYHQRKESQRHAAQDADRNEETVEQSDGDRSTQRNARVRILDVEAKETLSCGEEQPDAAFKAAGEQWRVVGRSPGPLRGRSGATRLHRPRRTIGSDYDIVHEQGLVGFRCRIPSH